MEITVKGSLFLGMRKGILKYTSETGYQKFLETIPRSQLSFWGQTIYPIAKVPVEYFRSMAEAVNSLWGIDVFHKIVAELAYSDLNAAMRFFLKIGSPSTIVPRFPYIFSQYFSQGELKVIKLDKNSLDMELIGAEDFGLGCCQGTLAWISMALSQSGVKNLKASHAPCLFAAGKTCYFNFTWE